MMYVYKQQRLVAAIGQWAFDFLFFPVVICYIERSVFSVAWCNGTWKGLHCSHSAINVK